jgi:hypothetical protein
MTMIDDQTEADLIARIRGEFREMPGLSLTIKQACRLWRCDAVTCRHVTDIHSGARRSLKAFPTTDTELKLIAAAAIIGLKRRPNQG